MAPNSGNPDKLTPLVMPPRDGASQSGRKTKALNPSYIAIDERSPADILRFTREYVKNLRYYGIEDEQIKLLGDWSGFLNGEMDIEEIVAFMENPDAFSSAKSSQFTRPHFALFLTFLHLLRHAQTHMNQLTKRHLDFYYQQILGMTKKSAMPDKVHVLVDLAAKIPAVELPAGTTMLAGTDSLGKDLIYSTDEQLVVNQAQIAKISSLYVDSPQIGMREERERQSNPDSSDAFMRMLRLPYGEPQPGSVIPVFGDGTLPGDPKSQDDGPAFHHVIQFREVIQFVPGDLHISIPDFYKIMVYQETQEVKWQEINRIITQAGKNRDANFADIPEDSRKFEENLTAAVKPEGGLLDSIFTEIPEIKTVYDAYTNLYREDLGNLRTTIEEKMFLDIDNFARMMFLKKRIDLEWDEINRILQNAAQQERNDAAFELPIESKMDFEKNLVNALDPAMNATSLQPHFNALASRTEDLIKIESLTGLYHALLRLEEYFHIHPGKYPVAIPQNSEKLASHNWDKTYTILAEAYRQKIWTQRRANMQDVRKESPQPEALQLIVDLALGDAESGSKELNPLVRLKEKSGDTFTDFLNQMIDRENAGQPILDEEWDRIIGIAELLQRDHLEEPVAAYVEWKNLYAYADATTVKEISRDATRWKTFGRPQGMITKDQVPTYSFGWAITSPLLLLSQGTRTINLSLRFSKDEFDADAIRHAFGDETELNNLKVAKGTGPFLIEISTGKSWIEPETSTWHMDVSAEDHASLKITIVLLRDIDPIVPLVNDENQPNATWPQLRLLLRQIWQPSEANDGTGQYKTDYFPFKALLLQSVELEVQVDGLVPSHMQNNERILDASKPFEPFGLNPGVGSSFRFAHTELVNKKLTSIETHFEWMDVPDNLITHYENYSNVDTNTNFTVNFSLFDKNRNLELHNSASLFTSGWVAGENSVEDIPGILQDAHYERNLQMSSEPDLQNWDRYLQWELNAPDFQHSVYPALAIEKATALSIAISQKTLPTDDPASGYQVIPPYTPKIKVFTVNYTAAIEISMDDYDARIAVDRLEHIHPFGSREMIPAGALQDYPFLPQFNSEGELYLGIKDVYAPQNLSILFQMAEGSADPDVAATPLQWSYLSGNKWLSMDKGFILKDSTRGLINSGIITFDLQPTKSSTLLPPEYYWLRVAASNNSRSVCDTIALHTQAVAATFVDNDNAPDHFEKPLQPESITEFVRQQPQISGIRQPYSSFGGKIAEQDSTFYTRISERLRHKQRPLTMWDYEHIILERFPELYKVKCLPAAAHKPGLVTIIVIPDIHQLLPSDPFEPKAPADLITQIEDYLKRSIPSGVSIIVKNPRYIPIKLRLGVHFRSGYNEGFYKQKLNDDLNRFLAPWAYSMDADISIGGRMYANVLIDYIEQLEYIDYVVHFKFFRGDQHDNFDFIPESSQDGYWVGTVHPDEVLVAARQHEIDVITEAEYEEERFTGINYMKIELDFIVG